MQEPTTSGRVRVGEPIRGAGVEARQQPTIATAIETADVIVERLNNLEAALGATLERLRGPEPPSEVGEAKQEPAGLLDVQHERLTEALRILKAVNGKAEELDGFMGAGGRG